MARIRLRFLLPGRHSVDQLIAAISDVAALLAALMTSQVAFILATVAAAYLLSAPVREVLFFFGSRLFRLQVFGIPVSVGIIPLGTAVRFASRQSEDRADESSTTRAFEELPIASQIATTLAGPVAVGILSATLIGFAQFWHHTSTAYPQIVLGVLHPATQGVDLLRKFFAVWEIAPFEAIGIFAAKNLAWCLLPLPGMPGFSLVNVIVTRLFGDHRPAWFHTAFALLFLANMFLLVGWSIPIVIHLATHFSEPVNG